MSHLLKLALVSALTLAAVSAAAQSTLLLDGWLASVGCAFRASG
jgi:hypothetical protein